MATRKRRKRRGHYHTGVYSSPKAGDCKYRSGWELLYMQHLDADPAVKSFGYETVKIPYVSNVRTGKLRHYYPDFLVEYADGGRVMVEIKPKRRSLQAKVQKKLKAGQLWCCEHSVSWVLLTEDGLKAMGLLK